MLLKIKVSGVLGANFSDGKAFTEHVFFWRNCLNKLKNAVTLVILPQS